MYKFNLLFGIEQQQYNLHIVKDVELPDVRTALKEARVYAEDLYMQDPVRDISEIEKEEGVGWEVAQLLFNLDMIRKTAYHVEQIYELNGEVLEVITHYKE